MSIVEGGDAQRNHLVTYPSPVPGPGQNSLPAAKDYLRRGFSVVPQLPGEKHPCVRWKEFQQRLPTLAELEEWLVRAWPEAGLALVLGQVSKVLVIDVDGQEAHDALVARLGQVPLVPRVFSGSGDPFRYHLFFRHPDVPTRARITPWHPQLEFRGQGGVVVLPPSLHRSGNRYRWAPGQSLDDLALTEAPAPVLETLAARAAEDVAGSPGSRAQPLSPQDLTRVRERARRYLARLPSAVEGDNGDLQTYTAACHLVLDFGLTPDQALPIFQEWNRTHCVPTWDDERLMRKLLEADRQPGERGRLLRAGRSRTGESNPGKVAAQAPGGQPAGPASPFLVSIPDFVLMDRRLIHPAPPPAGRRGRRRVTGGLDWLVHHAVLTQRSSCVVLPDVVLAQAVWGMRDHWPVNWRTRIQNHFLRVPPGFKRPALPRKCPSVCPLYGTLEPHRHLWIDLDALYELETCLGCLSLFEAPTDAANGIRSYDFAKVTAATAEELRKKEDLLNRYRKMGLLYAAYLPVLVFGSSSHSGLAQEMRHILIALTRETSRSSGSQRRDKAGIILGGEGSSSREPYRTTACPFLEKGKPYVGFNGNGNFKRRGRRGRGYRLVGRTRKGWLHRAGYAMPEDKRELWRQVRRFLRDLRALSGPFGLVAAGWNPQEREWLSLEDMIGLVRTRAGRAWLRACLLRVYTEADYLARWRRYFAERLGFSHIPGGEGEEPGAPPREGSEMTITSAIDLDRWMRRQGLTDRELADQLGVSRRRVSQQRSGSRPWSGKFQARLEALLAKRGGKQESRPG